MLQYSDTPRMKCPYSIALIRYSFNCLTSPSLIDSMMGAETDLVGKAATNEDSIPLDVILIPGKIGLLILRTMYQRNPESPPDWWHPHRPRIKHGHPALNLPRNTTMRLSSYISFFLFGTLVLALPVRSSDPFLSCTTLC